ncbi:Probable CoA ligase CCL5 [Linum grandiflorum]
MSLDQEPWNTAIPATEPSSGYDPHTGIYHSLVHLPKDGQIPTATDLDTATYVLSRFPHPDVSETKIALIDSFTGQQLTYGQLRRSIVALAAGLRDGLGVRKGDVVLLLSPNSILYPAICLAIMSIGAILTPANPVNTSSEIVKQANDSGAKLVISDPEQLPKLDGGINIPVMTTTRTSDLGYVSCEELIECCSDVDPPPRFSNSILQSETAAILYSSGTTGASKGVILTHSNFISVMTLMNWSVEAMSAKDDTFLCFLPMFHIYGLAFFALGLLTLGIKTVLMPKFDLKSMLQSIEKHRINNLPAVPPVILGMVKFADQLGFDLSSLRRVGTGAAALSGELGEEFRRRFPWVELRPGYGLTESCGATTMFAGDEEAKRRPEGCGRLLPCFEAKVVDAETGEAMAPYGRGELWVKSSTVMKGYLRNEEATAEAVDSEGWLRTGDLCYFDGEGVLYVVDRIKELIKHNGYQVAPAELEAILLKHPQVMDAAVIPIKDAASGEIPMAYVVRASAGLTEDQVIEFVAAQVAPYKKVRKVAFIDTIPKSAAGKILRKTLISLNQHPLTSKL